MGQNSGRNSARATQSRRFRLVGAALVVFSSFGAGGALILAGAHPAAAAFTCTDTWTGNGGNSSWSNSGNWDPGTPTSASDVCIPGGAIVAITGSSVGVAGLDLSAGSSLTVGSLSDTSPIGLTVSSALVNDGTLTLGPSASGHAGLTMNGTLANDGGASLTTDGGAVIGNNAASTFTNSGTWTIGSSGTVTVVGGSSVVQDGLLSDANTTVGSFNDGGTLTVDGGTICGVAVALSANSNSPTLTFGPNPAAGPACTTPATTDQISDIAGAAMAGDVPAGYTVMIDLNDSLKPTGAETNYGTIEVQSGSAAFTTLTSATFTNAGSVIVPSGTALNLNATSFTNAASGTISIGGTLGVGGGFATTVTNDGTWTIGASGTVTVAGGSSVVQDGLLSDANATVGSFNDGGTLTVDGGTICGVALALTANSPNPALSFGPNPPAGPSCGAGLAQDQISDAGGIAMAGDIPAGYTVIIDAGNTLAPTGAETNYGSILANSGGRLNTTSAATFTNAGSIDFPSGGQMNAANFTNSASGTVTVEGSLTLGNGTTSAVTNNGTWSIAAGGSVTLGGPSSIANGSTGVLVFGISGDNTSTAHYGFIQNGTITLGGTADPLFNGYTPPSGMEYFVFTSGASSHTGTFASILHQATADYSHTNEVGLVGGAAANGTTTSVASSAPTTVYGQSVQFTATVVPLTGSNPTGNVTFYQNGSIIGSGTVTTSAGVTTAAITTSGLHIGSDAITATYTGDGIFANSTSAPLTQTVDQDGSNVSVSPVPASPVPGQPDTITVNVTAASPGSGTPTGDVSLTDNGTPISGCQNLVMGPIGPSSVTCHVTYTSTGSHTIGASYAGDTDFTSASGSSPLPVQAAATSTVVGSSANPGPINQPITYTATVTVTPPGTGTPTGTLSFSDGATPIVACQSLPLPATAPFRAQCQQTYTTGTGHSISASYSGDTNYAASSGGLSETLQLFGTTTTISGPTTSTYGQPVSFTATVTPDPGSGADPSGTVSFTDNGTLSLGSVLVSTTAGVTTAVLNTSTIPAGSNSISATYSGDSTFGTSSTTTPAAISVAQASTTLGVASSDNPSVTGESVTFTATVTPGSGTGMTGTVTFFDNGVQIGTGSVSGGQATYSTSTLTLGSHPVTASYGGDSNFTGSSTSITLNQVVNQATTSTVVTSSALPGTVTQPLTYTATVTVNSPGGGTPTGTVSFSDGGSPISTCQNLTLPGTAPYSVQCQQTYSTTASHAITAVYSGDTNYQGSSGGLTETMGQVATATTVAQTGGPGSPVYGQQLTFTATVTPSPGGTGSPTGTVTFVANGTFTVGSASVSTTGGVATAVLNTTVVPAGTDAITATYGGDSQYSGGTSTTPVNVSVSQASTTLGVASSVNPSLTGQQVTFTATVTPGSGTGMTGTVTFFDNSLQIGTGSVSGGQATYSTSTLGLGSHPITASYGGDSNFTGSSTSSTLNQVVGSTAAASVTTLAASATSMTYGQNLTLTATVTPTAHFTGGTVTFLDNMGGSSGPVPVSCAGSAGPPPPPPPPGVFSCLVTPGAGVHSYTASYSGNATLLPSTSNTRNVTVAKAGEMPALTSTTATYLQSTPITVTVPTSGNGMAPTGTVTVVFTCFAPLPAVFTEPAILAFGQATVPVPGAAPGTCLYLVVYGGDANYSAQANVGTFTILPTPTTTTLSPASVNPSVFGQPVTFTASVSPGDGTGHINFKSDGTSISGCGSVALTNHAGMWQAMCTTAALPVGPHNITATYADTGATLFANSTSATLVQTVNKDGAQVALSHATGSHTATATVSAVAPGAGTPTGTVTFYVSHNAAQCRVAQTLSGGTATIRSTHTDNLSTATLIQVAYSGDANFQAVSVGGVGSVPLC